MLVINFVLCCARRARSARTAQSSNKMMTNFSENGYIHEFGFSYFSLPSEFSYVLPSLLYYLLGVYMDNLVIYIYETRQKQLETTFEDPRRRTEGKSTEIR